MPVPPSKKQSVRVLRSSTVSVLGLLQNQWFKDVERTKKVLTLYQDKKGEETGRFRFVRDMLFLGCLTGKRILDAFGEELCSQITFEEISTEMGYNPKSVFPPDEEHILKTLEIIKPRIVIVFGNVARRGLWLPKVREWLEAPERTVDLIFTCHPAARSSRTIVELNQAASKIKEYIDAST